jgi:hypothetical protein
MRSYMPEYSYNMVQMFIWPDIKISKNIRIGVGTRFPDNMTSYPEDYNMYLHGCENFTSYTSTDMPLILFRFT